MPAPINLKGMRFGKLKAIKPTNARSKIGSVIWECVCDCGKEKLASTVELRNGDLLSCGCGKYDGFKNHINNDRSDGTRVSSLKIKPHKDNKTGVKGICKYRGKWRAYIGIKGKQIELGYYTSKSDAIFARLEAEEKYHSEYKNTNLD